MANKAKSLSNKTYSVGEVISEEQPLVHVLDGSLKSANCDHCLVSHSSLKRCSKCLKQYYCDRRCQRSDWVWHRNECQILAINNNLQDYLQRLLLRLWLSLKRSDDLLHQKRQLFNGFYRCFDDFESHESEIGCDESRTKQFNAICDQFAECGLEIDRKKLFRLYGQLLINIFSIVVHDLTYSNAKIGYGVYVCASAFDHSCRPNAAIVFDGISLQIRAIRDIAKDEEIFVHYIALDNNRDERRLRLKSQYYFDCNCDKCREEVVQSLDYNQFKSLLNQLHSKISDESALNCSDPSINELLVLSQQIYGPIHPEMAAILMVVMQFQLLCQDPNSSAEDISKFIERVGRVIELSFGSNHKFYRMFKMFDNIRQMK